MQEPIYILAGARTAIGGFGGSLKDFSPTHLAKTVVREAISRAKLELDVPDHSVFGTVIPTEAADLFLGRTAAIEAGMRVSSMGLTVNRLCGSGAQAIISAAQMIRLGESSIAVAGGAEAMSRAPFSIQGHRYGQRMGDGLIYDWLHNTLADPFGHGAMGCTAENVANKYGIGRERQDAFAVESHRRATAAIADGRFASQIVPIEVKTKKGMVLFGTDEHVRPNTTMEDLAKLKPAFDKAGSVTAGNSSGINDGAAAVVLASEQAVRERGLTPIGRLVSWGLAGVPPEIMGIGPVHAVPVALERAGLGIADIDVFESNEAFAVQALSVIDGLKLDPAKVNPNGGAVALGHPLGATGAILTVKALYELQRSGGKYGVVTMCIGGGQGIALVVENLVR
ncbi:beta-ketothiolase BktB [Ramlibacter sp. WS9]|uniref:beta-ketothiolase BktB n=1 Tax=Ramlibacter sp. WS9 TaxID=1882741 RepID=UPI0011449649|nr:beta-ketothiolase BktB [Ramlibacter sp. WS9]ROZ68729.1 acetyl-CoA C-acyltransferase [Ramlibacter sp. WS9]